MTDTIHPAVWLKNPAAVFTANNLNAEGGLVVANGKIVELVDSGSTPKTLYSDTVDCRNSVILPGLINTHHHFYQTLTRCVPKALNKPLFPWLTTLYKIWQNLDPEMLESATHLATLELMLSGATTVSDHHYVFPKGLEDAIDIQAKVIASIGCRATLTRGSMSLGEKDGGLPPDSVIQDEQTILTDSQRVIDRYHQRHEGAMLQIALAPCSPFSVSKQLMIDTALLAEENDVLLHTHLAETEDENQFCLREYGARPLDYLEQCGWLQSRTWLAHGIHFNQDEISRLGAAQVGIAHCPSSNMLLASGICPTLDLLHAGCKVGLAVDGSASNDASNMIQEVRQSLLQQRLLFGAEKITSEQVLRFATIGSAQVLNRDDLGQLAVGKQADLALFDLDELRFSGAGDPIAALVQCGAHQASKLMVKGKWLIENSHHNKELQRESSAEHKALAIKLQNLA